VRGRPGGRDASLPLPATRGRGAAVQHRRQPGGGRPCLRATRPRRCRVAQAFAEHQPGHLVPVRRHPERQQPVAAVARIDRSDRPHRTCVRYAVGRGRIGQNPRKGRSVPPPDTARRRRRESPVRRQLPPAPRPCPRRRRGRQPRRPRAFLAAARRRARGPNRHLGSSGVGTAAVDAERPGPAVNRPGSFLCSGSRDRQMAAVRSGSSRRRRTPSCSRPSGKESHPPRTRPISLATSRRR
jgi:hypothetical protein